MKDEQSRDGGGSSARDPMTLSPFSNRGNDVEFYLSFAKMLQSVSKLVLPRL